MAPTILHQDLDLVSQGQCAQLGHRQDIAGGHRLVSVERGGKGLEEAAGGEVGGQPEGILPLLTSPPPGWVASAS